MSRMQTSPLYALAILLVISTFIAATPFDKNQREAFPTYFNYTEEDIGSLYRFDSSQEMNKQELRDWDRIAYELIKTHDPGENVSRIYAYLYTAQRDAGYLSYNIKQRFEGSFNSISRKVLSIFFPDVPELRKENRSKEDTYSNLLADIVLAKVKARLAEERHLNHVYERKTGDDYWVGTGKEPFYGQDTGSWKTWFLLTGDQFRVPQPPSYDSPFWKEQLKAVKEACQGINSSQKRSVLFWAGLNEDRTENQNGDWRNLTNDFLWNRDIPLGLTLLVRSTVSMGMADASIAVFDSKYTYWVKRPSMRDGAIKPFLTSPNHPSYPSGHSTVSNAAATILAYFFPQENTQWNRLAQEAGHSRIWCGIHYPIDDEVGNELGKKVGQFIVYKLKEAQAKQDTAQVPALVPSLSTGED